MGGFAILATSTLHDTARQLRAGGRRIAFVPTMGALHEGHLSLMRHARQEADVVVASIYVNPAQFGPQEDFARYPRDADRDTALARSAGVDYLWMPSTEEIYPPGYQTFIEPAELATVLEGALRPGHFRGVATVVYRLLAVALPDALLLGQKDAQQCVVIETMVRDLGLPVRVVRRPIVRDGDGLALSSRNVYLSAEERRSALAVPDALRLARARMRAGGTLPEAQAIAADRLRREAGVEAQYVAVVDGGDLSLLSAPSHDRALLLVAARVGATRLLDNAWLCQPDPSLD